MRVRFNASASQPVHTSALRWTHASIIDTHQPPISHQCHVSPNPPNPAPPLSCTTPAPPPPSPLTPPSSLLTPLAPFATPPPPPHPSSSVVPNDVLVDAVSDADIASPVRARA